jgi:hypothetical protein
MQVKEAEAAIIPAARLSPTVAVYEHPVYSSPVRSMVPRLNLPVMMMMRMATSVLGIGHAR